jgi:hypothetical protein
MGDISAFGYDRVGASGTKLVNNMLLLEVERFTVSKVLRSYQQRMRRVS